MTAGLSGGAASVLGSSYALAVEPLMRLSVTRYRVTPRGWPAGLKLRIAAIADLHAGEWVMPPERVARIAERTNALGADIIVLLGDYVVGSDMRIRDVLPSEWAEPLSVLKAPLGVHAILGNHDWWDDPDAQAGRAGPIAHRRALEAVGVPVYENDVVRIEKDGRPFWLAGLGDQLAFDIPRPMSERVSSYVADKARSAVAFGGAAHARVPGGADEAGVDDLPGTLAKITDDAPVILLAHEPDIFPEVPARVSLTLSGHTHGGQVRVLGYSPIVPSRYGNRYAYGHVVEQDRHLIVSGGLGCSILPVRFGVPPEIIVVDVGT